MRRSPTVSLRLGLWVGIVAAILTFTLVNGARPAWADGDPASDVLQGHTFFDPTDVPLPDVTYARLEAVLAASAKAGFPIRVALINSASDLGTVTQFWSKRQAGDYASYLDAELSNFYDGQVLVVMPGGFGVHGPKTGAHRVTTAERNVAIDDPTSGPGLANSALQAVPLLARADGHSFQTSNIHVQPVTQARGGSTVVTWIAIVAGLLIVGGCWRWSLRARPLRGNAERAIRA